MPNDLLFHGVRNIKHAYSIMDGILTIQEANQSLKTGKAALHKLVANGEIPARKIGREWWFVKDP